MKNFTETIRNLLAGILLMAILGFTATGHAADLYTLPGEDGLELFLIDNHLQAPALDLRSNAASRMAVTEDGSVTFGPQDSMAKYFGLNKSKHDEGTGYRGFRTSPLGRVLSVDGEFKPNLGPATMETADSQQAAERKFDLGTPQAGRSGWEKDLGIRILSF